MAQQNLNDKAGSKTLENSNASSLPAQLPSRLIVILGCLAISASAAFFYISTVFIRWAETEVAIDASFFVFFRFLMGFFVICTLLIIQRKPLKPRRYDLLIGRTVFNCVAVYCISGSILPWHHRRDTLLPLSNHCGILSQNGYSTSGPIHSGRFHSPVCLVPM